MKKTLEMINKLKEKGLIEDYAVGGGIASIFYTEPVFTRDLDVFVKVKPDLSRKIISLTSIYKYLETKGYGWTGEHLVIEGIPVQFFAAGDGLEKEAVENSKEIAYEGVMIKIFRVEYLIAISLKVNRSKDKERVRRFVEQSKIDNTKLNNILEKYGLEAKFGKIEN